jgi:hypothetical protein
MAMSSIKEWARTIYLVSVFSALALLIVPRSMLKQVRFVVEMLLIFCILAPLINAVLGGGPETVLMNGSFDLPGSLNMASYYTMETGRRIKETGLSLGLPVDNVEIKVSGTGPGFRVTSISVDVSESPEPETENAFVQALSAYIGVDEDRITIRKPVTDY